MQATKNKLDREEAAILKLKTIDHVSGRLVTSNILELLATYTKLVLDLFQKNNSHEAFPGATERRKKREFNEFMERGINEYSMQTVLRYMGSDYESYLNLTTFINRGMAYEHVPWVRVILDKISLLQFGRTVMIWDCLDDVRHSSLWDPEHPWHLTHVLYSNLTDKEIQIYVSDMNI